MMKMLHVRHPIAWLAIAFSLSGIVILLVDAYFNPQPQLRLMQLLIGPTVAIIISSSTLIRTQRPRMASALGYLGFALGIISIGLMFVT